MFHRNNYITDILDRTVYSRAGRYYSPSPSRGDGHGGSGVAYRPRKVAKRRPKSPVRQPAQGDHRQARFHRKIKRRLQSFSDVSLESEPQDVIDLCPQLQIDNYQPRRYQPNPRLYPAPKTAAPPAPAPRVTQKRSDNRSNRRRRRVCGPPNPRLYRPPAPRGPLYALAPPPPPPAPRAAWPPPAPVTHTLHTASSVAIHLTVERHVPNKPREVKTRDLRPRELEGKIGTVTEEYNRSIAMSAPSEFLAEFLTAIMQRKYAEALKYCQLILQYEPDNATARGFYPLLQYKLEKNQSSSGEVSMKQSAEGPPAAVASVAAPTNNCGPVTTEVYMPAHPLHRSASSSSSARGSSGYSPCPSPCPSLSPLPSRAPSPRSSPSHSPGSSPCVSHSELSLSDCESEPYTQERTSYSSGSGTGSGSRWDSCGSSPRDDRDSSGSSPRDDNGNTPHVAALRMSGDSDENDNTAAVDFNSKNIHDNYNAQESSETESWSSMRALRARLAASAIK